jgi:hypothetical protein
MLGPHIEHGGYMSVDFDLIFMIYCQTLLILPQVLVVRSVSLDPLTCKLGTPYVPYFVHTENVTFFFKLTPLIKNFNIEPLCENGKKNFDQELDLIVNKLHE